MSKPAKGEMTINELAERTGMTVRNIRAHQTRGLLPPPTVRGRTGYYSEDHVARITLTREMQADGLNLEAIRRVLAGGQGTATEIFDFTRAVRAPYGDESPEIVDTEELTTLYRKEIEEGRGQELMKRGEEIGIVRTLPGGQVEVISPRTMRAAAALAELGIDPDVVLETAGKLRHEADKIAAIFIDLFLTQIWEPFDRAGRPESDWPRVREALEDTRPFDADVLLGIFEIAMAEAIEKAASRTIREVAHREPADTKSKAPKTKRKKARKKRSSRTR